ncbi:MAG: hypothetical protein AAFR62_15590, partial [Cyanobacteria bacterium J06629_2]
MNKISKLFNNWVKVKLGLWRRGRQSTLSLVFLVGVGITLALAIPVYSQQPLAAAQYAQQGQTYYASGKLDQAIETWQQAAIAYKASGNEQRSRESYLNIATAQQTLGLYDRSCESLLSAFAITEQTSCSQIIADAQTIEPQLEGLVPISKEAEAKLLPAVAAIENQPDERDKVQGLLRFGDYLRASGYPKVANQALELSLASAENLAEPAPQAAALLSLGNARREIALQGQNQFASQTVVLDAVANADSSATLALAPYQPALEYYNRAAQVTPRQLDGIKAQLNRLSLLLDIKEYWLEAITDFNRNLDLLEISDEDFLQEISTGAIFLKQDLEQQLESQIEQAIVSIEAEVENLPPTR